MAYRGGQQSGTLPPEFDYKRVDMIKRYVDDEYKIKPRRQTHLTSREQRRLTEAIKRARFMGLIPYTEH